MPETNVHFVCHAEPDLSNHDDLTRAFTEGKEHNHEKT